MNGELKGTTLTGTVYGKQSLEGSGYPRGNDGISPIVDVIKVEGGHFVSITDIYGEKSFTVRDGSSPIIGDNGNWWVWDIEKDVYVDTFVSADYEAWKKTLDGIVNMTTVREALDISMYEKGSLNASGNSDYRIDSRARSIGIHTADYDKTIYSANGVEGIVAYFYDDDGNQISVADWCATLKIPAGSHYRLLVSLNPKAGKTEYNELSEILANFYFVNEYEIVKRIEANTERANEIAKEVEALSEKVGEGGEGGAAVEKVLYVSMVGNDGADGTAGEPLATFNKAIEKGATTIIASPGIYRQTISANGLDKLTIRAHKDYEWSQSQGTDKIILTTPYSIGLDDYNETLYMCHYVATPDSRMYKVFVSQELPLEDEDNSNAEDVCYNVNAYIHGDAFSDKVDDGRNTVKLHPVLTIEECEARNYTFCYHAEGNSIIVHYDDYDYNQFLYIPKDDEVIASFENCGKLVLENVRTEYGYAHGISIQNCRDVTLIDCEANLSPNGEGFYLNNTSAKLSGCKAIRNFESGFRIHESSHVELTDCYVLHGSIAGAYFGQGCTGTVIGGEYDGVVGEGITICEGAAVNVYDAVLSYNYYGLGVFGVDVNTEAKVIAMNNAMHSNDFAGMIIYDRTVLGANHIKWNTSDVEIYGSGTYEDLKSELATEKWKFTLANGTVVEKDVPVL